MKRGAGAAVDDQLVDVLEDEPEHDSSRLPDSYFPRRFITDFFEFLRRHRGIQVLTYDDLPWGHDWGYEGGYPQERLNWKAQLESGERDPGKAYVVLQYDVDSWPQRSMALLREPDHVPANVMIFNRRLDRPKLAAGEVCQTEYEIDRPLLRRSQEKGFVIGYHSNAFEQALFNETRAQEIFDRDVEELSKEFQIDFFSPHGGVPGPGGRNNNSLPLTEKWARRLRWVHNRHGPAFDGQFSDGGHMSPLRDPALRDLRDFVAKFEPGKRYRILLHPQYYDPDYFVSPRFSGTPWYDDMLASHRADPDASLWRDVKLEWARPTKVAILVNNDVNNDGRVLKNLLATNAEGFDAVVIGRKRPSVEYIAERGVPIIRTDRLIRADAIAPALRFVRERRNFTLGLPATVMAAGGCVFGTMFTAVCIRNFVRWAAPASAIWLVRSYRRRIKALSSERRAWSVTATHDWAPSSLPFRTIRSLRHDMALRVRVRRGVRGNIGAVAARAAEYAAARLKVGLENAAKQTSSVALTNNRLKPSVSLVHNQIEMLVSCYDALVAEKPDVIYANDLDTLLCAYWVSRELEIPFIYDAHELETARSTRSGLVTSRITQLIETKQARHAHHIISVSEEISGILRRRFNGVPVSTLHNVPMHRTISCERPTVREELGLGPDKYLMIYVGGLTIFRALPEFIQATAELDDDCHLVFLGHYHNPDFVAQLRVLAEECGVADRFSMLPPVPADEVSHFISTADLSLVLQPAVTESYRLAMPNKLFESTLAGVPMLYSPQQVCIAEFVQKHELGEPIELPLNPANIAAGIRRARARLKPCAPEKLEALRELYSWQNEMKQVFKIYEQIEGSRRRIDSSAPPPAPVPSAAIAEREAL